MKVFITGGAGFIGINAASYFLKKRNDVIIFDNFSRKGSEKNIQWLKKEFKNNLKIQKGDLVANFPLLKRSVSKADVVIHLAAQVAVTSSVLNPRHDFEVNALGTFNVLEAVRVANKKPILLYSSTNKVYGGLEHLKTKEEKTRYSFVDLPFGISEQHNLDFHSPYGCSKGSADQYVHDYARIYGLRTVVLRQSCIYGPHQFGIEDQGWLAWFLIALSKGKKITIYGNGKQVRDILYIDDLIQAYDLCIQNIEKTKGNIYNIGGGVKNAVSIWMECKPLLEKIIGKEIKAKMGNWRPGDQQIFISDIRKAKKDFGWEPKVAVEDGLEKLYDWIYANKKMFS